MTEDSGRRETPDEVLDRHLMAAARLGLALGRGTGAEAAIEEYRKVLVGPHPADACWCHDDPGAECGCGGPRGGDR